MAEETLQQALFGGNISGRRLRGVKINPIYQENDPGGRAEGGALQPGDSQSESALPIGEIQIEVYESLPRKIPTKPFRQHKSAPSLPSPQRQRHHEELGEASGGRAETSQGGSEERSLDRRRRSRGSLSGDEGERGGGGGGGVRTGEGEEYLRRRERRGSRESWGSDSSQSITDANAIERLPWTFLNSRSPARREPVWGAFPELVDRLLPQLREDRDECIEVVINHYHAPSAGASSSPSDSALVTSSMQKLGITSKDDHDDVGVNTVKASGDGEPPGDNRSSSRGTVPSKQPTKGGNIEFQTYFVTAENTSPRILPSHGAFPYDGFDCFSKHYNGKNGYSDLIHFAEHNHHHYSLYCSSDKSGAGYEKQLRDGVVHQGKNGTSGQCHYSGGNSLVVNRIVSPEDGHVLCPCSCHAQKRSHDFTHGMDFMTRGADITSMIVPKSDDSSCADQDRLSKLSEKVLCVSEGKILSVEDNVKNAKSKCDTEPVHSSSTNEKDSADEDLRSLSKTKHNTETKAQGYPRREDCVVDVDSNNDCLAFQRVEREEMGPGHSDVVEDKDLYLDSCDTLEGETKVSVRSSQESQNIYPEDINSVAAKTDSSSVQCSSELCEDACATDSNSSKTLYADIRNDNDGDSCFCKLCGCPKRSNRRSNSPYKKLETVTSAYLTSDETAKEMTPPYLHTPKNVSALLSSDAILLRADELNAPAYLQRYLVEAQRNFLRQQERQLLHDDSISDFPCTPHPSPASNNLSRDFTPTDLIVPDTGELRENVIALSCEGEQGDAAAKPTSAGKSFRCAGAAPGSRGNSGQSSRNNSRQSSRNSRVAKPSSIEDIEAAFEEEGRGEGVGNYEGDGGEGGGSQWGGSSSNRSNSSVDRNDNLKKNGLSIIHVGGTTSDPAFEMIVPYDETMEEESNYSSRRRQRLEEIAEEKAWKDDNTSLRDRVIKAAVCTLLFCLFVGIFVGVAIHFGKESLSDENLGSGNKAVIPAGSAF